MKNIERMSIHEFVTIVRFYLDQLPNGLCSKTLAAAFCLKIIDSITEFNEL